MALDACQGHLPTEPSAVRMVPHMDGSTRRRNRSQSVSTPSPDGVTDRRDPGTFATPEVKLRLAGTPPLSAVPADDTALATLRQACRLLDELRAARAALDERLAASGRRDPLRVVTGRTALDRACAETEELIRTMDELLTDTAERLLVGMRPGVDA